jgi:hypothetical protein
VQFVHVAVEVLFAVWLTVLLTVTGPVAFFPAAPVRTSWTLVMLIACEPELTATPGAAPDAVPLQFVHVAVEVLFAVWLTVLVKAAEPAPAAIRSI